LLAACGKEPVRSDLVRAPHLDIRAGDVVTIGGDYPMTITEVTPLGDGWYAGKGKTRLKTIIDAPIALRFDRLRIIVDKNGSGSTIVWNPWSARAAGMRGGGGGGGVFLC